MLKALLHHDKLKLLLAMISGAITPLAFAPYDWWLLAIVSLAAFNFLLFYSETTLRQTMLIATSFGLGYYGIGVSWIFVSIYVYGGAGVFLATLLTAIFVIFMAIIFALPFYLTRWIKSPLTILLALPFLWVTGEWVRSWLLTGFPWLYVGYSHLETPLSGWAPIGGVLLLSFWSSLTASVICCLCCYRQLISRTRLYIAGTSLLIIMVWLSGFFLQSVNWTQIDKKQPINIGIVQPNIPQDKRWLPEYQSIIEDRLISLSDQLWHNNWIIWPEGVIPDLYHRSLNFIDKTEQLTQQFSTTIITGVLYDEQDNGNKKSRPRYYNSIIGIGNADGIYHKQRLVPFGEYVPLESLIRGLIQFFDLPFSVISSGTKNQSPIRVGQYQLGNAICYEIAYPALVAEQAQQANVLLTVSNDAWFGNSIGPHQHFQMARMRALEIGRYVIRGTNNGISAIIDSKGNVTTKGPQFVATTIEGQVFSASGETPFMIIKHKLILLLLIVWGAICCYNYRYAP